MIPARHSKIAKAFFHRYIMHAMKKQFHALHLFGREPEWPTDRPLLILPNHSSWWDGFFIYVLNEKLWKRRPYVMMLEPQLAKHRFFSRLGAFSIDPETAGGVRRSLRYTREILRSTKQPRPMVCIFAQGELLPWHTRPLTYKPGIRWLLRHVSTPVCVVQLGIRLEFLLQQKPQVFFEFSDPLIYSGEELALASWEKRHRDLLERMSRRIAHKEEGKILLQGTHSVDTRWLRWRRLFTREMP
ncbi:MAG TPA: lysophospholipid acyltransferase family protein [bacterium]|nr:lysophospholipid acyltransferase family protein [bacterium]HPN34443.1 lysophospholipid acyltransferase family protein [bacterium]